MRETKKKTPNVLTTNPNLHPFRNRGATRRNHPPSPVVYRYRLLRKKTLPNPPLEQDKNLNIRDTILTPSVPWPTPARGKWLPSWSLFEGAGKNSHFPRFGAVLALLSEMNQIGVFLVRRQPPRNCRSIIHSIKERLMFLTSKTSTHEPGPDNLASTRITTQSPGGSRFAKEVLQYLNREKSLDNATAAPGGYPSSAKRGVKVTRHITLPAQCSMGTIFSERRRCQIHLSDSMMIST